MKKIFIFFLFFFLSVLTVSAKATIYLYYGEGCPHCALEKEFLNSIKNKYDFNVITYEVWYNDDNNKLMLQEKEKYNVKKNGVPLTIINSKAYVGFNEYTGKKIEEEIRYVNSFLFRDYNMIISFISKIKKMLM